jgi:hypothetical protein
VPELSLDGIQLDRIERKVNALCKAAGGLPAKLDLSDPRRPADAAERKLAEVRAYAVTLSKSAVSSEQGHAATLLAILGVTTNA